MWCDTLCSGTVGSQATRVALVHASPLTLSRGAKAYEGCRRLMLRLLLAAAALSPSTSLEGLRGCELVQNRAQAASISVEVEARELTP